MATLRASARSGPIRLVSMGAIDLTGMDPGAAARVLAQPKRLALFAYLAARPPGERVTAEVFERQNREGGSRARADGSRWSALDVARARALEIDPESGEARATLGLILIFVDRDHRDAAIQFRRAVELSPGYATAHQWRGQLLTARGQADEGLAELDVALELDFLSPAVNEGKGLALYHAGRAEEAIGRFERTLELDPGYWRASLGLSLCHAAAGRMRAAAEAMLHAWGAGAGGGTKGEARRAAAKLDRGPQAVFEDLLESALRRPIAAPGDALDRGAAAHAARPPPPCDGYAGDGSRRREPRLHGAVRARAGSSRGRATLSGAHGALRGAVAPMVGALLGPP